MPIFIIFFSFFLNSLHAFQPHPITPYPVVGYKEISFTDDKQLSRTMLVWYPVAPQTEGVPSTDVWDVFDLAINAPITDPESKKPVLLISHGYAGSPHQLSWLINKFVYEGYIVLGIQHRDLIEGVVEINQWQRAQDIQTILDQFIAHPFSDFADLDRIGIAGYSLGGTTAALLAGGRATQLDKFMPGPEDAHIDGLRYYAIEKEMPHLNKEKMAQDWKEQRIKAAFLMAPAWAWVFDRDSLQKITIPTYIVAPEADNVLVTQNNSGIFAKHIPNVIYQVILGQVNHYVFVSIPKNKEKLPSHLNHFITNDANTDRAWIQIEVANDASLFFHSQLKH